MDKFLRILKKLLFIPLWLMMVLIVISAVSLTAVFVMEWDTTPIAYAVYVLSFYTLSTVCVTCYFSIPRYLGAIKQKAYDSKYGNKYLTDIKFKTRISLYRSLIINLLYVATNLLSGFIYGSAWFGILAAYYTILAVMRFLLVRYVQQKGIGTDMIGELRRARLCAIILLTINLSLSGAVLMILYQNRGFEYHGILIYVMAMYTFYITVSAIINLVKYRKYHSPVMSTANQISLAAALVSMLSLETAMLSEFGVEMGEMSRRIMVAATGGGISLVVVAMSAYTIIVSIKEIRHLRKNNSGEIHNGQ